MAATGPAAELELVPERPETQAAGAGGWTAVSVYALILLFILNLSSYLDRSILAILSQPIKQDLRLQDWQVGVIGGPAFGLLYSLAGIPIARLAERMNRINLVSLACAVWSGMTAACGVAAGFLTLGLARAGTGGAEGAASPISYALVTDYFAPRQRGRAMSVLMASSPCAQLLAPLLGGFMAMHYGWRAAFLVVGLPGLLLALLMRFTLTEPRQDTRVSVTSQIGRGRFLPDLKRLFRVRAFSWLFVASTFMMIGVAGTQQFTAMHLMRTFHLSLMQAGVVTATGMGAIALLGTVVGGVVADRFAGRYGRSYFYVCAASSFFSGVFFLLAFRSVDLTAAIVLLFIANFATSLKNGTAVAANMRVAPPDLRATSAAIIMFSVVVLGTSLGPLIIGLISDGVAAQQFPRALGTFAAACPGGRAAASGGAALVAGCAKASAGGLRAAMLAPSISFFFSGALYCIAGRSLNEKLDG